mgnify:CR=1 FL=1
MRFLVFLSVLQISSVLCSAQAGDWLVIADFRKTRFETNIGTDFGTWDKDPADPTQGCAIKFSHEDAAGDPQGHSIRIEYDVNSPRPAYCGFWLKIDRRKAADFSAVSLAIKGDREAGFPGSVKLEIKIVGGKSLVQYIDGITGSWRRFDILLKPLADIGAKMTELTIVFEDTVSRPKRGAILIDDVILRR